MCASSHRQPSTLGSVLLCRGKSVCETTTCSILCPYEADSVLYFIQRTHEVVVVFVLFCLTGFTYHNIFMWEHGSGFLYLKHIMSYCMCVILFILCWGASPFGCCKECCCELGYASPPKSGLLWFFSICLETCLLYHTIPSLVAPWGTTALLSTGNVPTSLCSCQQCQRINILCILINNRFIFMFDFVFFNSNYPECDIAPRLSDYPFLTLGHTHLAKH